MQRREGQKTIATYADEPMRNLITGLNSPDCFPPEQIAIPLELPWVIAAMPMGRSHPAVKDRRPHGLAEIRCGLLLRWG